MSLSANVTALATRIGTEVKAVRSELSAAIGTALLKSSNLSDLTSTSTARTNLGVAIGSNVQAFDAKLASVAGLTAANDRFIYFTGPTTAVIGTITASGRALIDDASTTAQRSTLGLGSIATQAASAVAVTGGTITGITDLALADGGTGASTAASARTNLGVPGSTDVLSIVEISQVAYDALGGGRPAGTLYVVTS